MDHIRIDDGLKRGKRDKPGNPYQDSATGRFAPALPVDQRRAAIERAAERIAKGELLRTIAAEIGVTVQCLSKWLLDDLPAEYHQAQRMGLISRVTEADESLSTASTPIELARAREQCRFSRWDIERRLPRLFGQTQHVTLEVVGDLGDRLRRAREREIQGEYERIQPPSQVPD